MTLPLINPIQYPLVRTVICQRSLKHSLGLHFACVRFLSPSTPLFTHSMTTVTLYLVFIITLASRSVARGRPYIWREDIRELPWFGQEPGYPGVPYGTYPSQYGPRGYPGQYPQYQNSQYQTSYPASYGGNVVHQQPGHSLVIQPSANGGAAAVHQVPF